MLSRSETIVAHLASEGLRNEEISELLERSVGTIKNQLSSAFRKLGVRNRVELTRRLMAARQAGKLMELRKPRGTSFGSLSEEAP